jgi:rhodanese-related sulfurtransferase
LFPAQAAAPATSPASDILNAVQRHAENSPDVISPAETTELVRQGAVLLDVRTVKEYEDGHIEEARNIPLGLIVEGFVEGLPEDRSQTIVTICGVGKRSLSALLLLKAQGYERVKSSRGGMQAWMAEKQPLKII